MFTSQVFYGSACTFPSYFHGWVPRRLCVTNHLRCLVNIKRNLINLTILDPLWCFLSFSSKNIIFFSVLVIEAIKWTDSQLMVSLSPAACHPGFYKAYAGNLKCSKCPPHSFSYGEGASICRCEKGFFRAMKDPPTMACTRKFTPPRNLAQYLLPDPMSFCKDLN